MTTLELATASGVKAVGCGMMMACRRVRRYVQVCVAVHGGSGGHSSSPAVPEWCGEGVLAVGQGGGVPPGLRVLPVPEGFRTGSVEQSDNHGDRVTEDQGSCAAAVKGLAVLSDSSGAGSMAVTYSRGCQLQMNSMGR